MFFVFFYIKILKKVNFVTAILTNVAFTII